MDSLNEVTTIRDLQALIHEYMSTSDLITLYPTAKLRILHERSTLFTDLLDDANNINNTIISRELSSIEADSLSAYMMLYDKAPTIGLECFKMLPPDTRRLLIMYQSNIYYRQAYIGTEFKLGLHVIAEICTIETRLDRIYELVRLGLEVGCESIIDLVLNGPTAYDAVVNTLIVKSLDIPKFGRFITRFDQNQLNHLLINIAAPKLWGSKHVLALLQQGAQVNSTNADGLTALMMATKHRSHVVMDTLLENGADVNAQDGSGRTILMMTAQDSVFDLVPIVLRYNPDVKIRDCNGRTALMHACTSNNMRAYQQINQYDGIK